MFWIAFALLAFNFYGYITLLYALGYWLPLTYPPRRKTFEPAESDPFVSILVPNWDERSSLRKKITNLLRQPYALEKKKIYFGGGAPPVGPLVPVGNENGNEGIRFR